MKKNCNYLILKVLAIIIISRLSFAQSSESPWPMFGHDERHTYTSHYKGPDSLQIAWIFTLDEQISKSDYTAGTEATSPIIGSDGSIYITTEGGYIYSISHSGVLNWKLHLGGEYYNKIFTPAIGKNGIIYIAVENDPFHTYLYALDVNGKVIWKKEHAPFAFSSPAIGHDGTIYIGYEKWGAGGGGMQAINSDGSLKWNYETPTEIACSPAIDREGSVYFGTTNVINADKYFYAVNSDGTEKWKADIRSASVCPPSIDYNGNIYYGSWMDGLFVFKAIGAMNWRYIINQVRNILIPKDGLNVCRSFEAGVDRKLVAFNNSGDKLWEYDAPFYFEAPAADSTGMIYLAGQKSVLAIDQNGKLSWEFDKLPGKASTPVVLGANKNIYLGIGNNKLCALSEDPWQGPPDTPRNVSLTAGHDKVAINWSLNNEKDLAYYVIYRSVQNGFTPTLNDSITKVLASTASFIDENVERNITYYYRLAAVDNDGNKSGYTKQYFAKPEFTCLENVIVASGDNQVKISWKPHTDANIAYYVIYRSLSQGFNAIDSDSINFVVHPKSEFIDKNVVNETTYYYIIKAIDNEGKKSDPSKEVSAKPFAPFIQIISPVVNKTIRTMPVNVSGAYKYSGNLSILVNNKVASLNNNTFACDIYLSNGERQIVSHLFDENGNWIGSDTTFVTVQAPTPGIALPGEYSCGAPWEQQWFKIEVDKYRTKVMNFEARLIMFHRANPYIALTPVVESNKSVNIINDSFKLQNTDSGISFTIEGTFTSRSNTSVTYDCSVDPYYGSGSWSAQNDTSREPLNVSLLFPREVKKGNTADYQLDIRNTTNKTVSLYYSKEIHDSNNNRVFDDDVLQIKIAAKSDTLLTTNAFIPSYCDDGNAYVYGVFFTSDGPLCIKRQSFKITYVESKKEEKPFTYELFTNFPNPFNPTTTIRYSLPKTIQVRINIYNSCGQLIDTLVNGIQAYGQYTITWDASDQASGLYFYSLETEDFKDVKKMILVR